MTRFHTKKNSFSHSQKEAAFLYLVRHVRQQRHKSCALHGLGELALRLCTHSGLLARHDASVRIQELLEKLGILVVDEGNVIFREETLLFHWM